MRYLVSLAPLALLALPAPAAEPMEIPAHRSDIFSLAFAPDGKMLASASKDRSVRLWDATSGEEIRALNGHGSDVLRIAISPDGKQLASGGADGTLRIWNVAN